MRPDGIVETRVESISAGDRVEVRAGETIPVDGIVESGGSSVDRAIMTGESRPVSVRVGDQIHAGEINLTAALELTVIGAAGETRLAQLMAQVEDAMDRRAPVQILANRIAGIFVIVVLVLAALTFIGWSFFDMSTAINATVALLIVTCPCALGLATPLVVSTALGRAARQGIFIKGGDVLEKMASRGIIVFDKTGTVTAGDCALTAWYGDVTLREPVARCEAQCDHPVAKALAAARDPSLPPAQIELEMGQGIAASVDGMLLTIGSERFLLESGIAPPDDEMRANIQKIVARGESPVLVARGSHVAAVASIGDPVRPEASEMIAEVRALGWQPQLLSGDLREVAAAVASRIGIEPQNVSGGATPEQKSMHIRRLASQGVVVMVGDGVNDAAALAEASVGIAVSGGTEASLSAADVLLTANTLSGIGHALEGSRRVTRIIWTSVAFSILYNTACATLAISGLLTPLLAAVLMPASSLTVLLFASSRRSFTV